jgi:catechol 2,3-dioxygenase-like lactoylglutathione lyase family enzyme
MARVTGIGGIFFKSRDPKALGAWYRDRLGLDIAPWGGAVLSWRDGEKGGPAGHTVWNPFDADTKYFEPSDRPFMVNLRVDDLEGLLASLRASGERVLDRREDGEQGKFGYVVDPDGTLLELWEPSPADPSPG